MSEKLNVKSKFIAVSQSAYQQVAANVETCCTDAGRKSGSVSLVVVSKTFSAEDIQPVLDAGGRVFGENRVQEAYGKWPDILAKQDGIELHLIGPLQSNKAAQAVGLFDVMHTIDREKIALAVSREMEKQQKSLQLFVQVNTANEEQKAGVSPDRLADLLKYCREECGLEISGLMCIPPFDENPGPHFALLQKLGRQYDCPNLSMGMSGDYETAIEFGATHVRIGSAIFGGRG